MSNNVGRSFVFRRFVGLRTRHVSIKQSFIVLYEFAYTDSVALRRVSRFGLATILCFIGYIGVTVVEAGLYFFGLRNMAVFKRRLELSCVVGREPSYLIGDLGYRRFLLVNLKVIATIK